MVGNERINDRLNFQNYSNDNSETSDILFSIENYNTQKRGGVGVIGIKTSTRNGKVVGAVNVGPDDQIIMITNKGKTIKISINDMPIIGRNTQGVRLQVLQDGEKLVAISTETIVSDE